MAARLFLWRVAIVGESFEQAAVDGMEEGVTFLLSGLGGDPDQDSSVRQVPLAS
jgi:hypothetical protein